MADEACERLSALIKALAEGRCDELAPEDITVLEAHLNECAVCGARLAEARATLEPGLDQAFVDPPPDRWDGVWERITASSVEPVAEPAPAGWRRVLRSWASLSAAAAVLMVAALWQFVPQGGSGEWDFRLAGPGDVAIESLEVFGGSTALTLSVDEDSGVSIVWVMEEEDVQS